MLRSGTIAEDPAVFCIGFALSDDSRPLIRANYGMIRTIHANVVYVMTDHAMIEADVASLQSDVASVPADIPALVANVAAVDASVAMHPAPRRVRRCEPDNLRAC